MISGPALGSTRRPRQPRGFGQKAGVGTGTLSLLEKDPGKVVSPRNSSRGLKPAAGATGSFPRRGWTAACFSVLCNSGSAPAGQQRAPLTMLQGIPPSIRGCSWKDLANMFLWEPHAPGDVLLKFSDVRMRNCKTQGVREHVSHYVGLSAPRALRRRESRRFKVQKKCSLWGCRDLMGFYAF